LLCFSISKSTNLANFLDSRTNNSKSLRFGIRIQNPVQIWCLASVCILYPSQVWKPVHYYWEEGSRLPWSMFLLTWGHSTHQHSIQATMIS
jgi:hypothetical protein